MQRTSSSRNGIFATPFLASVSVFLVLLVLVLSGSSAGSAQAATQEKTSDKAQTMQVSKLTSRMQAIIPVAAFTARGDEEQLRTAFAAALDGGMPVSDVKEVVVQMYAYCGFPRSLTAMGILKSLVEERAARGIRDDMGREPTPVAPGTNMYELGAKNQTTIVGRPVEGGLYDFAPVMNVFLREHLFGAIFARDLLSFQEREIATVSALAALPAKAQLKSHLNCCLVTGLTPEQLQEYVAVLQDKVGSAEGELAGTTLATVLAAAAGR